MPESLQELVKWIDGAAGSLLQRLELAVTTAQDMEQMSDQLVGHYVEECRREGLSWAQIGEKLGVTKQAAQQRFVPKGAPGMFERFTERARNVLANAQEEARAFRHNYIGTEHLLLALFRDLDGLAAKAAANLGLTEPTVRRRVTEMVGVGPTGTTGSPPFTPRARKVLELTYREALQLGHNYVGTEHILLGLIAEGEGIAAQILKYEGATYERVRAQVLSLLAAFTAPSAQARKPKAKADTAKHEPAKKKTTKAKSSRPQASRRRRKT